MPLENANYISELDPNNPLDGEGAGQGDDHLRVIKRAIKQTFPNFSGPVELTDAELQGLPQNLLNGVEATINFLLPHTEQKGSIKPWSTAYAPVPSGWQLCDGTNNTPDLRGRFIVGSGAGYAVGNTGGASTKTTNSSGDHNHGGSTAGHALTIAQMPPHNHDSDQYWSTNKNESSSIGPDYDPSDKDGRPASIKSQGGGQAHSHGIGSSGSHTHSVDVRPPYYALAWIIKTSEITSDDIADLLAELSGDEDT
ncbi:hypothetical protein [Microbulbifer sp. JMSA008]|uniref:hypothetical protein n=1 Tax=Microbulbifer sp. JMSA008 TaxID=3243373 RepID=UPI004039EA9B